MSPELQYIPLIPILGVILALGCLWGALRSSRRQRLMNDLPTSKTTGVFIGLVELKGTAETSAPLRSFLAESACVHYEWAVQEHWSRLVTETYTDSEGKRHTRTRMESGWTTVASGGETCPFYLKDDCGSVLVIPEGAKLESQVIFNETCGRGDPLYYSKGPEGSIPNSDHRRLFHETAIPLHAPLYIVGQARERQDVVAPEIAYDKAAPMFLISTRSEEQISSSYGGAKWGWGIFGLVLAVAGFVILDRNKPEMQEPNFLLFALVAVIYGMLGVGGWVWMVFNSLVDLRQRVRQGWSQVDVQLKRRFDLIPNLERVVKGIQTHERDVQTTLARLRAETEATPPGQPGRDHTAIGSTLVALAERYPELTAQSNFMELQKNLVDTEQRIALARGYYNEIATYYNTRLEIIPDRFVARIARMAPATLMAANDFERAPVNVQFAQ
jgi:hypothetical protein